MRNVDLSSACQGASRAIGTVVQMVLTLLCLFGVDNAAFSQVIPTNRLVNWIPGQTVGVPGGIPNYRNSLIDVTKAPYGADNTGTVDCSAALQAAVNAAGSNDVIFLPAGTYLVAMPINVKNFVTVRGASMQQTKINYIAGFGSAFSLVSAFDWKWEFPGQPTNSIVGGSSKGSTNLIFASASPSWVGKLCLLKEKNDPNLPVLHTLGYEALRKQMVQIRAVTGSNVSIWPPLYWTLQPDLSPTFAVATHDLRFAGVEDLTINAAGSTSTSPTLAITQGYGCWLKNVKVIQSRNRSFGVTDSLQCEIRGCWAEKSQGDATSNHAGLLFEKSSGCLIEDNIFNDIFPNIEVNFGACGNVFAYNFANITYWGGSLNGNHNPHNHYNLWEGNVSPNFQSDGYYGSASEDTLFRNWFHTEAPFGTKSGIWAIKLNRFARNETIVGNILGTSRSNTTAYGLYSLGKPNIGNENWSGLGPPWALNAREGGTITFSQDGTNITTTVPFFSPTNVGWTLNDKTDNILLTIAAVISPTAATTAIAGTRTNHAFVLTSGVSGYRELDTNVLATALIKGNFYFPTATPLNPALTWPLQPPNIPLGGSEVLPPSLYLSAKPSWFGTNRWPAFGPDLSPEVGMIPAQARFLSTSSGLGDTNAPSTPLNLAAVGLSSSQINLSWAASTDDSSVAGYRVERAQGIGATNFTQVGTSTGASYNDAGLAPSTTYIYRVRAVDGAGNVSGYSIASTATTLTGPPPDTTAPSTPASVVATGQSISQINVTWAASTDNVGVTGYRIERSQGVGSTGFILLGSPSSPFFIDNVGLAPGTIYNYRVQAVDAAGNVSGYSATTSSATLSTDTSAPTAPGSVSANNISTNQVSLVWLASTDNTAVAGYRVERSQGAGSSAFVEIGTTIATGFTDSNLLSSTTYNYRLRATDGAGNLSPYSVVATFTTLAPAPSSGLIASYGFNETTGTAVKDSSGNVNVGFIQGATRTTQGRFGGALSFNGVDNVVWINPSPTVNISTNMTLEAWVFPTAKMTNWHAIIHREADAYYLSIGNPNGPMLPAGGGTFNGGEQFVSGTNAIPTNGWVHLATTYDGTTLKLYQNGSLISSRPMAGTIQTNSNILRIGGNTYAGQFFSGRIDEVRIYGRALSQSEIQFDMNFPVNPIPGKPSAPAGLRFSGP